MAELVLRRREAGVGIISLNRPEKHNAMDDAVRAELRAAIDWALGSSEVRCLLLRGEGPSFCSGRDTTVLGKRAAGDSDFASIRRAQDLRFDLLDSPKPVVAALHGHVIGGGMELALAADMRIAARDVRMRLPEVHHGLMPDTGGTQVLTTLIGPSKTKYLVMSGDVVDAEQALRWGIVDWLVDVDQLAGEALALAGRLAAGPPLALAMGKQLVDQLWGEAVRRGIRAEMLAQSALFKSSDHAEARSARQQGREPDFQGT